MLHEVARSGRFLMVPWAAGGSVIPELGLADALMRRGHVVEVLGSPVLRHRFERLGCTFRKFRQANEEHVWQVDVFEQHRDAWAKFSASTELAEDVLAELEDHPSDAVIVDFGLFAALTAGEKSGVPTAALLHNLYMVGTEPSMADGFNAFRPLVNATRLRLGMDELDATKSLAAHLRDRASLALACMPKEFDYPTLTTSQLNLRYVGPMFEACSETPMLPSGQFVLVSLSTTNMCHGPVLQAILDALDGLDVQVLCTLGGVSVGSLHCPRNVTVVEGWLPAR